MTDITVDNVPLSLLMGLAEMFPYGATDDGSGRIGFLPHVTKLIEELHRQIKKPVVKYVSFKCEGQFWVIEEGERADKWRKQGFTLYPVKPSQCLQCTGTGEFECATKNKVKTGTDPVNHRSGLVDEVKHSGVMTLTDHVGLREVNVDNRFSVNMHDGAVFVNLPDEFVIFKRNELPQ